jgi:hypothetical protein
MDFIEAGFAFLEAIAPHVSEDNPFMGSDNPKTAEKIEKMEDAAYAVRNLLYLMEITPEQRKKLDEMVIE